MVLQPSLKIWLPQRHQSMSDSLSDLIKSQFTFIVEGSSNKTFQSCAVSLVNFQNEINLTDFTLIY